MSGGPVSETLGGVGILQSGAEPECSGATDCGIDCGKVSKLHIQKDDEWRVNYDRGWEIIPRPEDYEAYDAIMEHLNSRPLWPFDFE